VKCSGLACIHVVLLELLVELHVAKSEKGHQPHEETIRVIRDHLDADHEKN
jgi:hypothetical protein